MQNNQFKKLLRSKLEEKCKDTNLIPVYVDLSNNKRLFFIYTQNYQIKGQLSMHLTNSQICLRIFSSSTQLMSISDYDKEFRGSYLNLDDAFEFISDFVQSFVPTQV